MPPFITKKSLEFAAFMFAGAGGLAGCATLGELFEGSFGMEGKEGDKYECVENLDTCVKRCEIQTKSGDKYFKEFKLPPEQCEKEHNI